MKPHSGHAEMKHRHTVFVFAAPPPPPHNLELHKTGSQIIQLYGAESYRS
jgi:hypothetical protein